MNHLIITGGSGGLGSAIAQAFLDPIWEIATPGHRELDVSNPQAVENFLVGRPVDLLVCAAGLTLDSPLKRLGEQQWDDVLSVNFQGAADCAAAVLPWMVERGVGHIIFISSHSAFHPPVGQIAYSTSKAALLGLTTSLAYKYGSQGIRVNAILPGFLETPMTATVSVARKAEILSAHTLGRFNKSGTVARFVRYLHEQLPDTSGQILQLDSRLP